MRGSLRLRKVPRWPAARFGSDDHVLAAAPSNPGLRYADPASANQPVRARRRSHPSRALGHSICLHEDVSSITSRFSASGNLPGLLLENESGSCPRQRRCRELPRDRDKHSFSYRRQYKSVADPAAVQVSCANQSSTTWATTPQTANPRTDTTAKHRWHPSCLNPARQ